MCGIAGIFNRLHPRPVAESDLRQMLALLRHRGPDEFGLLLDGEVGLGNARLSIIDLSGGSQPIANEDESLWIVFNGEIFNYVELRPELEARGHRFRTASDTEVILHLFEEFGPDCLHRLNGQFAIAIWDRRRRALFLARDRLGVRPLFYTETPDGELIFASEIKSLLCHPNVRAELDPVVVAEIFRFWAPLPPRTVFRDIVELPAGHYLEADARGIRVTRFWANRFPEAPVGRAPALRDAEVRTRIEEFRELLIDACRIRLRADVPVGAYLSGGLDSSTIASVVRRYATNRLVTFSIAFTDQHFDESAFQREMAAHLGTEHHVVCATHADIGRVFPEVIWHTETPIMRTSPAPMFLLSKLVRESGFKVVLTGEGADEFLAGYDIFKEAKVRRFWAAQPDSALRPLLFKRLYPDIPALGQNNAAYLSAFFGNGVADVASPLYSHAVRWRNNSRTWRFFEPSALLVNAGQCDARVAALLPPEFGRWTPLAQAQFLEIAVFLSQYLLSSQGDRVAMAHSIEGRFPFLDVRVVEFCNRLDPRLKLRGLTEKWLLKQAAQPWLPDLIRRRPKRPYRAPIHRSFFNDATPDYVRELLAPDALRQTGLFRPAAVTQLVTKIESGAPVGETDDMALAGILSTQLVHHLFVKQHRRPQPLGGRDRLRRCCLQPVHA
ncbi:MAG: asparagine synthase (glutamine-hydrolyzing) [Verrucomicrobiales bacterium]|nr:asparagine synthase (glutamine-hydrolyzing) [Verrucomicrobiales bacterium]